jgi:uncharacterized protein YycO
MTGLGIGASLLAWALGAPAEAADGSWLRTGDVIFQESTSEQSAALKLATKSRYTHVGLVVLRDGAPWVLEAVQPVRWTPLAEWVDRGVGDHAVVKRLRTPLDDATLLRVVASAQAHVGKAYDFGFRWSDDQMYCSELVYKAYQDGAGVELAVLPTHQDYDLTDPRAQAAVSKRYPGGMPRGEPVVAPSDLLGSPLLVEVGRIR